MQHPEDPLPPWHRRKHVLHQIRCRLTHPASPGRCPRRERRPATTPAAKIQDGARRDVTEPADDVRSDDRRLDRLVKSALGRLDAEQSSCGSDGAAQWTT
jgi:hypothetical protein